MKTDFLKNKNNIPLVFTSFFEVIDAVKQSHLKAEGKSYAKHMALGALYDSLEDLVDTFIESYQGKYGIVDFDIVSVKTVNIKSFLENRVVYFENSYDLFKDSYMKNQLDAIIQEIYHCLYKLNNLL